MHENEPNVVKLNAAIENGDAEGLRDLLQLEPQLANAEIRWGENNQNASVPLHRICDVIFNGELERGSELDLTEILLAAGADTEKVSATGRDTPLIAAASLYIANVGVRLIDHGANIHFVGTHGATALHWAAWTGTFPIVDRILEHPVNLEQKCSEYGSTPLFWAVHGYARGPERNRGRQHLDGVMALVDAGADIATINKEKNTMLDLFDSPHDPIYQWLERQGAVRTKPFGK